MLTRGPGVAQGEEFGLVRVKPWQVSTTASGGVRSGLETAESMARIRLPLSEVVLFTRQLEVLMGSGIPVHRALEVLSDQTERADTTEVLFSLQRLVLEGRYLSAAMSKFPGTFGPMYTGLVRVGERTGTLQECAGLLADWLERDQEVQQKVKGALTYPAMVTLVAGLSCLGLMNGLGPIFIQMFAEQGRPLPFPTQVVVALVKIQRQPWFWFLLAGGGFLAFRSVQSWIRNPHWRVWWYSVLARTPAIGTMLGAACWSRYAAALSILLRCGVQPQQSYRFAAEVSGDPRLVVDCDLLIQSVLEGESAAKYMHGKQELYPPLVASSMELADETGRGKPILDYLTRFYREDLDIRLQILQSLLEPLLLLATSAVLLFLILSLMLPLYGKLQDVG